MPGSIEGPGLVGFGRFGDPWRSDDLHVGGAQLVEASCPVGGMPYPVDPGGWQRPRRSGNSARDPTQASSLAICPSLAWGLVPGFEVGGVGEFSSVAG